MNVTGNKHLSNKVEIKKLPTVKRLQWVSHAEAIRVLQAGWVRQLLKDINRRGKSGQKIKKKLF